MDPIVSYCGGASIVWNPISLSASPGSRHDLKVMPTLRLRNIKMDFSNTDIDLKSQVCHDPKVMPTLRPRNNKMDFSNTDIDCHFMGYININIYVIYINIGLSSRSKSDANPVTA